MPARSQMKIRRDINRLNELCQRHGASHAALAAVSQGVASAADSVNRAWQAFQTAAVAGAKERAERDSSITPVMAWIQRWRPVVIITVPGVAANLAVIPARNTTPDDVLRAAEDLRTFIEQNTGAAAFRKDALDELGTRLTDARKEHLEAVAARPMEEAARDGFSTATHTANGMLVPALSIVRSVFGPTSVEYKQFIARATPQEEEEDTVDSAVGETPTAPLK